MKKRHFEIIGHLGALELLILKGYIVQIQQLCVNLALHWHRYPLTSVCCDV